MARSPRVEFAGAVYHIVARGHERRRIFHSDAERQELLDLLSAAVAEWGWRLHGYCLMPNHYHLLLETPRGNLSAGMQWLQTTYTVRFNRRHQRAGPLFQGRFKAHLVQADAYARTLLRYVHLNPMRTRAHAAAPAEAVRAALAEYPWSSHLAYLGTVAAAEALCLDWLSFFGPARPGARSAYRRYVEEGLASPPAAPWAELRHGLVLGEEEFAAAALAQLRGQQSANTVRWMRRQEDPQARRQAAQALAATVADQRLQVWLRVTLGGERRGEVAASLGYADGSAVTQTLKRLALRAAECPALKQQMAVLQERMPPTVA